MDAVSGATFTSNAVLEAACSAFAQALGQETASKPKAAPGDLFIPGSYTGTSKGFGGDVTVQFAVSEKKFKAIEITGDHETENIGSFAVEMLGERIMAAQSPNVDAVTGATGDGILMAEAVGADLVDIDQIQLHPTVEQSTSMLITEGVRGAGAILVNQEGKRFIDELLTRDVVSAGELEQPGSYAYIIFDQHLRDGLKAIEKYVSTGITVQADTIEGLAELLDIDPATLADTLSKWNKYVADQYDPDFGRTTGMEADLSQAPYYAIKIAPGIHHTMGGIHIDPNARVINTKGEAIPGLYAAGEVAGGVHGGNRIGGTAVTDIVVFGRVASESAIAWCDR